MATDEESKEETKETEEELPENPKAFLDEETKVETPDEIEKEIQEAVNIPE